jgi:hypothetical protein
MISGDIILTRNAEYIGNSSPGYWNHAAISCGSYVVEAQEEPNAVIAVKPNYFLARYPEYVILRYPDIQVAYYAAKAGYSLVGTPYRKISSLFFFLRKSQRGENCVSIVRKAWKVALGRDPRWRIPDDIYREVGYGRFYQIDHHKDYDNWVQPKEWFGGRLA